MFGQKVVNCSAFLIHMRTRMATKAVIGSIFRGLGSGFKNLGSRLKGIGSQVKKHGSDEQAQGTREKVVFFVVGIASCLLLWSLTKWSSDDVWLCLAWLVVDLWLLMKLLWLLPRRWRRVAVVLVYVSIYVLGISESFIYQRYYMHFTPQTLSMITETTDTEATGFLKLCVDSPKLWDVLTWWGILLVAQELMRILLPVPRKMKSVGKWMLRLILIVCVVPWVMARVEIVRFLCLDDTEQLERVDNHIFYSTPWRIVYSLKYQQLSAKEIAKLADNMHNLAQDKSVVAEHDGKDRVIVFVVGESYNKHHSAIYGYGLPTTPFQTQCLEDGVMVAMNDAVTPWNVTSSVFKNMFSTHSTDQKGSWAEGALFPALFRKAGYKVHFYSNQFYKSNRQTSADYNGSFFLNSQPFDSLCFDYRNKKHYVYDQGLLHEIPNSIAHGNHLVIVHLLGQHQPYADRVPKKQLVFSANDVRRPDLAQAERQTVADYDNATLVNDSVLKIIYNKVKNLNAVVVYLADHGEEVYDDNIGMFGRNHTEVPTPQILKSEFEVPLEFFVTPKAKKADAELMTRLREANQRPFSIDDMPHVLLALAGIRTSYYSEERDLLSPNYKPRRRLIKNTGKTYEELKR